MKTIIIKTKNQMYITDVLPNYKSIMEPKFSYGDKVEVRAYTDCGKYVTKERYTVPDYFVQAIIPCQDKFTEITRENYLNHAKGAYTACYSKEEIVNNLFDEIDKLKEIHAR